MSASDLPNPNKACCTIPPVQTHGYEPKGTYETFEDMQVYTIGHPGHKTIICIFDIFGFYPQVLQGADLLAALGFRVLVPDFFRGNPYPSDKFPPYESPLRHFPSTDEE
jgi:dienelactone hydrolase